jgi:hypothetical protein
MPETDIGAEEQKKIMKEALKEWLDEQFAALGRWTLKGAAAIALAGVVYLFLISQGWKK